MIWLLLACTNGQSSLAIDNWGSPDMEGHNPDAFPGMGAGLFTSDDLGSDFPTGVLTRIMLSFDLADVPGGTTTVDLATLHTDLMDVREDPFTDIGPLVIEAVHFDAMAPELWDLAAIAGTTPITVGSTQDEARQALQDGVDLTELVQRSLDEGWPTAQLRLFLTGEGDGDGLADMVSFYTDDINSNQAGAFTLRLRIE